ncbi:MAG TPA: iron dependent repressor, metal binding and dimerization domain protein [Anaerolineae bacterium]|nr:iron dependent repressor, metal binding and dimerization domain protein [Anaerolineae bacterium]
MVDPLIALTIGALLLAAVLAIVWPKRGLLARWQEAGRVNQRVRTEDALKHIHKCEMHGRRPTLESLAGALQLSTDDAAQLLGHMQSRGLIQAASGDFSLTPDGRESALHIVRAHRLWERYLADQTGYSEQEWHEQAERLEHALQPEQVEALAVQLGNPTHDPHGDPIPDAAGNFVYHGGRPLSALALNAPARIVHIEDEPETVYAQLVAEGLYPGMDVRLLEVSPTRVRFWANGDEHLLAPLMAANVSVLPIEVAAPTNGVVTAVEAGETLAVLRPGQQGQVLTISPRCRGVERRRMMDLGILPGTVIAAELISPGGDPTAYRIRGAMIALRREQAQLINIQRMAETTV